MLKAKICAKICAKIWATTRACRAPALALILSSIAWLPGTSAATNEDWQAVLAAARGQTVYFNGWGGSEQVNGYVEWAAAETEARYGVRVVHVRIGDIAEVIARILAEKIAGRDSGGTVDLLWINGENFAAMKGHDLLGAPFTESLPNFALVDTVGLPATLVDFTVPTDGLEAPWGMAQLVFIHDTAVLPTPPTTMQALLTHVEANPGRFTYPLPPAFHGTTFLKQALLSLSPTPERFREPVGAADPVAETAVLWDYLDRLHPHLWRGGDAFPPDGPTLIRLLDDGEIDIALSFNPQEASAAIDNGLLPDTARTYVLDGGTLGNAHFLAIPYNASARAGALVFIDFLLSPEAQARKADYRVWGDPSVLDIDGLAAGDRAFFNVLPPGPATLPPDALGTPLPEPHPSWTGALEAEWLRRYGG